MNTFVLRSVGLLVNWFLRRGGATLYLVIRMFWLSSPVLRPVGQSHGRVLLAVKRAVGDFPTRVDSVLRHSSEACGVTLEQIMKTQGEIESAISAGMSHFEQEYMGRGPKDVQAHLIGDLIVVRLKGVLTAAEQHLVRTLVPEKGRDLLKEVRTHLIEIARPTLVAMVEGIVKVKVVSLHHDISTLTGEEVVLFSLSAFPQIRENKKR